MSAGAEESICASAVPGKIADLMAAPLRLLVFTCGKASRTISLDLNSGQSEQFGLGTDKIRAMLATLPQVQ